MIGLELSGLERGLEDIVNVLGIIAVVGGFLAYLWRRRTLDARKRKIEALLSTKNRPGDDSLTLYQIAIHFNLSEDQVREASQSSNLIEPWGGPLGTERRLRMKRKAN